MRTYSRQVRQQEVDQLIVTLLALEKYVVHVFLLQAPASDKLLTVLNLFSIDMMFI